MMVYILKVIACTALLLGIYLFLFEKEKNHYFKRAYLLSALILSIIIPFISFETQGEIIPDNAMNYLLVDKNISTLQNISPNQSNDFNLTNLLYFIYGLVALFMLFKFLKNIFHIIFRIKRSEKLKAENYVVVLISNHKTPYSFLNYIFLDKEDYLNQYIETEILTHEQAHVKQKHTLDIIFIELLKVVFWFNPFLGVYKKAIQTNHEYLADEYVLKNYDNVTTYQMILFQKISKNQIINLTSSFNYLTTKKRLIMMTRTTSKKVELCKQFAILPLAALTFFLFSTKTIAQEKVTEIPITQIPNANNGISEKEFKEYNTICNKYKNVTKKGYILYDGFSKTDRSRLQTLFLKMSTTQQSEVAVLFSPVSKSPLPKVTPAKEQFKKFKNSAEYGVWINYKKVSNKELDNYTNTDFNQVFISKLYGAAKKNVKYNYQVDLMTKEFYSEYVEQHQNSVKENKYNILTKVNRVAK